MKCIELCVGVNVCYVQRVSVCVGVCERVQVCVRACVCQLFPGPVQEL